MELMEFLRPELAVLVPVLYVLGGVLKKSPLQDWLIPFVLCVAGCVLSFLYLVSLGVDSPADWLSLTFSAITQGVICAACSVYAKNLIKQAKEGMNRET